MSSSLNDINVLERYHVFSILANDRGHSVNFTINGNNYLMGYYLADGILLFMVYFCKNNTSSNRLKSQTFCTVPKICKDAERAFRILQARFNIVCGPTRFRDEQTLVDIMKACIIMYNIIIEDESGPGTIECYETTPNITMSRERTNEFMEFIETHQQIRDRIVHSQLQHDHAEDLWNLYRQAHS